MFGCLFPRRKALYLTQEEALGLLEMCAFTLAPERQPHALLVSRIGELCRDLRGAAAAGQSRTEARAWDDWQVLAADASH